MLGGGPKGGDVEAIVGAASRDDLIRAWRGAYGRLPPSGLSRQLLEHALDGSQPVVEVGGRRWAPAQVALGGGRPQLAGIDGLSASWPRIASLFAGLIEMSTPSADRAAPLGVRRRERYVFSRRGVLGLLDALESLRLFDPSTSRLVGVEEAPLAVLAEAVRAVSVERMRDEEDRDRVATLVVSLGLEG